MTLMLRHPFDLIANFVAAREVVLSEAAEGILGTAALATDEVRYLDAAGNRNGSYDLGDYLAAVDRAAMTSQLVARGAR